MLLVCVRQCPMELARFRVELFEERDVHLGFPAVVNAREAPAACTKANKLSSWLRLTLGNHDDRFLSAVTVLAAHLLTEAIVFSFSLQTPCFVITLSEFGSNSGSLVMTASASQSRSFCT